MMPGNLPTIVTVHSTSLPDSLHLSIHKTMRYSVHCPSAPYENSSFVDIDDAWGLCLDLSEEFGYAEVRLGEHVLGSYTDGR